MNDKKWEKFFELLDEIVNLPEGSWQEKKEVVQQKASEYNSNLEEFIGWFQQ